MADTLDVRFFARAFFDSEGVMRRLSAGERRLFVRYGGAVRTIARRSMRPGGKKGVSAKPGEPPRTHEGSLRRLLFFAYEPESHSVVVGPAKFKSKAGGAGGKTVPEILEYGGTAVRQVVKLSGGLVVSRDSPLGRKSRSQAVGVVARYAGNAYMVPAAAKAGPVLTDGMGRLLG